MLYAGGTQYAISSIATPVHSRKAGTLSLNTSKISCGLSNLGVSPKDGCCRNMLLRDVGTRPRMYTLFSQRVAKRYHSATLAGNGGGNVLCNFGSSSEYSLQKEIHEKISCAWCCTGCPESEQITQ
jgi:hypothetical protein